MTLYVNNRPDSVFSSVEFTPALDGNFSFFGVKDSVALSEAKKQLASMGQTIIAETAIDGRPMLVTRGKKTDYSTLESLAAAGNDFKVPEQDKGFKPWKLRGWASMFGQPLQLASAALRPQGMDGATAGFAILNIIANITNIAFGAEQTKDTYQLQHLKRKFNYELSKYLPEGASSSLPSSVDQRLHLRATKEDVPSIGKKIYNFLRRNSVSFCEIGLRYIGSVILFFPVSGWRKGVSAMGETLKDSKKNYFSALKAGASAAYNSEDKNTARVGMVYVAGKTLAFTSKIPDPYDPKPHSWLDTIREKVVFRLSSSIEAVAAGLLAYDRFFKRKISYSNLARPLLTTAQKQAEGGFFRKWVEKLSELEPVMKNGQPVMHPKTGKPLMQGVYKTRDWLGGVGGALFTMGLLIRIFAKYGQKEVNMPELNAHIVDGLAQVPQEKLPQLIADFSAYLTDHFKGKVAFGEAYKELTDGLYRYHQIAVPGLQLSAHGEMDHKHLEPGEAEESMTPANDEPGATIPHADKTPHRPVVGAKTEKLAAANGNQELPANDEPGAAVPHIDKTVREIVGAKTEKLTNANANQDHAPQVA